MHAFFLTVKKKNECAFLKLVLTRIKISMIQLKILLTWQLEENLAVEILKDQWSCIIIRLVIYQIEM